MDRIKFVSPCCRRPLGIDSLDAIDVEFHKFDEDDEGSWSVTNLCCGDHHETEAAARKELGHYRALVFKASVSHARAEMEKKVEFLREELERSIDQFREWHDPTVDRVFVSATWGQNASSAVANHGTHEWDTAEDAAANVNAKSVRLMALGYAEVPNDEVGDGMKLVRKFVKDDQTRYAGYWSVPVCGGGSGPTETEGGYLNAH